MGGVGEYSSIWMDRRLTDGSGTSRFGASAGRASARPCPWATIEEADPAARGPLYPQLRAHRRGVSREQVIADQRARIYGAMVEAVVRHGYEGATIVEVARLAGVSTRTFYERCDNKEACLLGVCEAIVEQARMKVLLASDAGLGGEEGGAGPKRRERGGGRGGKNGRQRQLASALAAFGHAIAGHPKEASLVLLRAPTAGTEAFRQIAEAHALVAVGLARSIERDDGSTPSKPLLLGAVHGVSHVASRCLLGGRAGDAVELLPALQGWLLDCASPAAACLNVSSASPMGDRPAARNRFAASPRGDRPAARQIRSRAAVRETAAPAQGDGRDGEWVSKRLPRIAAEIAAREGYRAVSVARICQAAQIDTDAFFALFEGPEDCLRAARELLSVEALTSALHAIERRPGSLDEWCDAVRRALTALLVRIAEDDALQTVGFLEPIGSEGVQKRVTIMGRFADVLMKHAQRADRFDPAIRFERPLGDAVVGAFWGIVQERVLHGQAQQLPSLAGPVCYLVLCPVVGVERALETGLRAQRAVVS